MMLFYILIILSFGASAGFAAKTVSRPTDLPHTLLTVWDSDTWTVEELSKLRPIGIQGVAKIVGAVSWADIEKQEGKFDFSRLESFLTRTQKARLWVIPAISMNTPPAWFIAKYPSCLMRDARGNTRITTYGPDDGQILSPWFVAGRKGDRYIKRFVDRYLDVIAKYPNVNGVFVGNEAAWVYNRPWKFGDSPELTYFACFDDYGLADYKKTFGSKFPEYKDAPKTYDDIKLRGKDFSDQFERWYQAADIAIINKYLNWIGDRVKYKIVNVGRLGFPWHNYLLGTTDYQVKSVFAMMAKHSGTIENFEALDSSVCAEVANWTSEAGLIFSGENIGGPDGKLDIALKQLQENKGQLIIWVAFVDDLKKIKRQISDFNSQFPPFPLPPPYRNPDED